MNSGKSEETSKVQRSDEDGTQPTSKFQQSFTEAAQASIRFRQSVTEEAKQISSKLRRTVDDAKQASDRIRQSITEDAKRASLKLRENVDGAKQASSKFGRNVAEESTQASSKFGKSITETAQNLRSVFFPHHASSPTSSTSAESELDSNTTITLDSKEMKSSDDDKVAGKSTDVQGKTLEMEASTSSMLGCSLATDIEDRNVDKNELLKSFKDEDDISLEDEDMFADSTIKRYDNVRKHTDLQEKVIEKELSASSMLGCRLATTTENHDVDRTELYKSITDDEDISLDDDENNSYSRNKSVSISNPADSKAVVIGKKDDGEPTGVQKREIQKEELSSSMLGCSLAPGTENLDKNELHNSFKDNDDVSLDDDENISDFGEIDVVLPKVASTGTKNRTTNPSSSSLMKDSINGISVASEYSALDLANTNESCDSDSDLSFQDE